MSTLLVVAVFASLAAQDPQAPNQSEVKNGSISGTVKDPDTGSPVEGANVMTVTSARWVGNRMLQSQDSRRIEIYSDASGHYRLADLPPGRYQISAYRKHFTTMTSRRVNLPAGQDLASVDFAVPSPATVTGRVLDQNKEPMPGVRVVALARQYQQGKAAMYLMAIGSSDDRGEYKLDGIAPGVTHWIMARLRSLYKEAVSDAPADPKMRKASYAPTFYPGVLEGEAGMPLLFRSGELREGLDIALQKAPSYCVEGKVLGFADRAKVQVWVNGSQHTFSTGADGGIVMLPPNGPVDAEGRFRFCDLSPGNYAVYAFEGTKTTSTFAREPVSIVKSDLKNVQLKLAAGPPLKGTVAWDGEPPDPPIAARVSVWLRSAEIAMGFAGLNPQARVNLPGDFSLESVFPGENTVTLFLSSPRVYVKDVLYGGVSVGDSTMVVGSAMGNAELKVVVAHDGGKLNANVADKDGHPAQDAQVLIFPANPPSEAVLSAKILYGSTDQDGNYICDSLAPGKYIVLATPTRVDANVDRIARLWRNRMKGKTVEVTPKGTLQVSLEPVVLDR